MWAGEPPLSLCTLMHVHENSGGGGGWCSEAEYSWWLVPSSQPNGHLEMRARLALGNALDAAGPASRL